MQNLGAKEAANAIRDEVMMDRTMRGDPNHAHQMNYVKAVVKELGLEATPENIAHVATVLREHDIDVPAGQEYPKYATRKWDNTSHIVNSREEEDKLVNEEAPEQRTDTPPPARVIDRPVQDLSLDLRDKVPTIKPADHPGGFVPGAVTNREAAQDAYARQPGAASGAMAQRLPENEPIFDPKDEQHSQHAADAEHEHGDQIEGHPGSNEPVTIDALAPTGSKAEGGQPYAKPADVGVMAHDDADGDGIPGQDVNPTHDSVLGTDTPQKQSTDSSAGKVEDPVRRPVGNRRPM